MMTTIRSFVAIELSDKARSALTGLQNQLKAIVPPNSVRWTATQNIHLTLHFLGDIDSTDVKNIAGALRVAASDCGHLSLTLTRLGCFPNIRRPRIVWVGVEGDTTALEMLHRKAGTGLKEVIGFKPERRPYSPHLTIGRVRQGLPSRRLAQLSQALEQIRPDVGDLARLPVTKFSVIKSELKPGGAVYRSLETIEL